MQKDDLANLKELMESVSRWECDCGIEWRALQNSEHRVTVYACVCGRRRTMNGKIVRLYYVPAGGGLRALDWKEVSVDKFEILS